MLLYQKNIDEVMSVMINLINEKDLNTYLSDIVYHGQEMETFTSMNFQNVEYVHQHKDAIVRSILM